MVEHSKWNTDGEQSKRHSNGKTVMFDDSNGRTASAEK